MKNGTSSGSRELPWELERFERTLLKQEDIRPSKGN